MRLYLSSYLFGNQPEKFIELVPSSKKRVALILNALDNRQLVREEFSKSQSAALKSLGFSVEELDLRTYFGKQEELRELLNEKEAVWINGGNAFLLRRAMKQSGFDIIIRELLEDDNIVYGGFSAAVVVLSPSLCGLDIIDDPIEVSEGYEPETLWDGLGIIDFSVAVHFQSNHSESKLTDQEIEYYKEHKIPYKTLRDGEVMRWKGKILEVFQ